MDELNYYKIDNVDAILQEHGDMVYKVAFSQTKNHYNAEEVFQEVFLRLVKKSPKVKSKEHLKAWLIRVTINCSKNIFLSLHFKNKAELKENIEDTSWEQEKSDIYYAIMELPKKYSVVIHLYYYEGYSIKEIGEILNKKEATVKTALHRGRKLLQNKLKGVVNIG